MAMLQIACLLLPPALQAWLGRPPPPLRARLALLRMSTPAVGSPLPLPPALSSLDGVPGSVGSLEELADGRELLVHVHVLVIRSVQALQHACTFTSL